MKAKVKSPLQELSERIKRLEERIDGKPKTPTGSPFDYFSVELYGPPPVRDDIRSLYQEIAKIKCYLKVEDSYVPAKHTLKPKKETSK